MAATCSTSTTHRSFHSITSNIMDAVSEISYGFLTAALADGWGVWEQAGIGMQHRTMLMLAVASGVTFGATNGDGSASQEFGVVGDGRR